MKKCVIFGIFRKNQPKMPKNAKKCQNSTKNAKKGQKMPKNAKIAENAQKMPKYCSKYITYYFAKC